MTKRMSIALLGLFGLILSVYLALYHYGYIGTLACNVGSCERVQTSRYAMLFGVPVAVWGVCFYTGVLALSLAGMQERLADSRQIASALLALSLVGVVFTGYFNYLEAFVIHAWCEFCLGSAAIVVLLALLTGLDWRETGTGDLELGAEDSGLRT